MPIKHLRNQRGDVLVIALAFAAISLISSLMMLRYSGLVEANSKHPRVKSMMTATEAKVRELLMSPTTYLNCTSGAGATDGRLNCALDVNKLTSLSVMMPDAACPANLHPCGLRVTRTSFDNNLPTPSGPVTRVSVNIKYEGTEMVLRDIDVIMDIPADILQSSSYYQCPDTKPKFMGFTPQGQMICESVLPLPAQPGEFLNNIDMNNLKISFFDLLPSSASCPSNQYVDTVNWGNGGTAFSFHCADRANPFKAFGFTPGATAADPTYTVNTD